MVPQNLMVYVCPWFTYTSASKPHAPQNLMQQVSCFQNEMNLHKSVGRAKKYYKIYFKVIGFERRIDS